MRAMRVNQSGKPRAMRCLGFTDGTAACQLVISRGPLYSVRLVALHDDTYAMWGRFVALLMLARGSQPGPLGQSQAYDRQLTSSDGHA